ncbi:MAG: hypothetical protein ACOC12_00970 [Bacteroidota bacterium]
MTLIKIIAIFVLAYLIFRFVTLYILPWALRWFINKQKEKFYQQNPHFRKDKEPSAKKGDIRFSGKVHGTNGKSSGQIGEYVDYEEIKEDKKKDREKES